VTNCAVLGFGIYLGRRHAATLFAVAQDGRPTLKNEAVEDCVQKLAFFSLPLQLLLIRGSKEFVDRTEGLHSNPFSTRIFS
jgi:hypothetical protein